jgi:hypothetical protein
MSSTITHQQYNAMCIAWLGDKSINAASTIAGVSFATAKKYIEDGSKDYAPIRTWAQGIEARARRNSDDEMVKVLEQVSSASRHLIMKVIRQFPQIDFAPSGIVQPDGSIHVNERSMLTMLNLLSKYVEVDQKLKPPVQQQSQQQQVGVSVNVDARPLGNDQPKHEVMRAKEIAFRRRNAELYARIQGTVQEADVPGALIKNQSEEAGGEDGAPGNGRETNNAEDTDNGT